MKSVVFGLVLFFSTLGSANSTYIILSYSYGNQIGRSQLTVLSNGLVMSSQIIRGRTSRLQDEQLSPKNLVKLQGLINAAAKAPQVRFDGGPSAAGIQS